jgi:uncharacterized DUF497 family protein
VEFEWDENKRLSNLRKHGLDFEDGWRVFDGPCVSRLDVRFEFGEPRFRALGLLFDRVVEIAYVERPDVIRLISMRRAGRHEKTRYYEAISGVSKISN